MKERYEQLLQSGMFWELYPKLSGNWEIDKEDFISEETWLDNNFRNNEMMDEYKFEPLKQLNMQEPANVLKINPKYRDVSPTPILVLYLDIRDINNEDLTDHIMKTCEILDSFKSHGWESLVIPYKDKTKLEIAAVNIDLVVKQEFETFKKQILEEINGSKSKDSE